MKILIMPNLDKKNSGNVTNDIIKKLIELEFQVLMAERFFEPFQHLKVIFGDFYELIKDCDLIVTIGGDGTIIHTAKHAVCVDKPILGINAGRLGFMAGLEPHELDKLDKLKTGDYITQNRMLIEATHYRATRNESIKYYSLNEVVIANGAVSSIVELDIECDGKYLTNMLADGVIFSTPTGSTAYALSAGGPVICPQINAISMTTICSHSLLDRAMVFSDKNEFKITVAENNRSSVYFTVDGDSSEQLEIGDWIEIKKSDKSIRLLNLHGRSFYEVLSEKFRLK